jgi:hypothetical protein
MSEVADVTERVETAISSFLLTLLGPSTKYAVTMIGLTTTLLALDVIMTTTTTAIAQEPGGCFIGYCNPEAPLCRAICPDRPPVTEEQRSGTAAGKVSAISAVDPKRRLPRLTLLPSFLLLYRVQSD